MLAQSAKDVDDALEQLDPAAGLELKLDGARVQVHKSGDEVRVFTRRLNDVSVAVPELVEAVQGLRARAIVLDGEVLALNPDGTPHALQVTMRRFGRKVNVEQLRQSLPLRGLFFDCLHLDGEDLIDLPANARVEVLRETLEASQVVP